MKDPSIYELLQKLERDLGADAWVLVDHWEADDFATGIASRTNPKRLVYVCTFQQPPDHYSYQLEYEDTDSCFEGAAGSYEELLVIVRKHLVG